MNAKISSKVESHVYNYNKCLVGTKIHSATNKSIYNFHHDKQIML